MVVNYWFFTPDGLETSGWAVFKHDAHAEEFIAAHPEFTTYTISALNEREYDGILSVLNNDLPCVLSSSS